MKRYLPIPARDRGGAFTLNNPDDGTPIREMFTLADGLIMVTEKCTYRIQLADQIDPKRENPNLPPNFQQKLFDHGIQSDSLRRTLLQAKVLFRKEFQSADIEAAMHLVFDALSDAVAMDEIAHAFVASQQTAIESAESVERKDASQLIPAVGNVRVHCKSFAQKADHFAYALLSIIRLFYKEMKGKNWSEFYTHVRERYGSDDLFTKVLELTIPVLQLVRATRDCLDHGNLKGVEISDFRPLPDGTIELPSIEVDFRKSVHERCPVAWFMENIASALLDSFEMIVMHTCSKHSQPFAGLPMVVGHLPEEYQKAMHVRFGYGTYYEGHGFVPCG